MYEKLKEFITTRLFTEEVNISDPNILRNLAEIGPRRHLYENFAKCVNDNILEDSGPPIPVSTIKLSKTRPTAVNQQEYLESNKTVFNIITGDSNLELRFAKFLDLMKDVQSFAKNHFAINFFIEYINASGEISNYYPDFIVRNNKGSIFIIETKGLEDLNVLPKWRRLVSWCNDATTLGNNGRVFNPLFVSQHDFDEMERTVNSFDEFTKLTRDRKPT